MNISFIGSGNVATVLSLVFQKAGHNILNIHSKNFTNAHNLAVKLQKCKAVKSIKKINKKTELLFICIQDDEIKGVLNKIKEIGEMTLIHTSGSIPLTLLQKKTSNSGVFYPLYSFNKEHPIDLRKIPLCIESDNKLVLNKIKKIGEDLKMQVCEMNSQQRFITHIAAIFAGNFSNYMYILAEKLMRKNNLQFAVLLPLINETCRKATINNPSQMQTGPAKRNDKKLIKKHLHFLKNDKNTFMIYNMISKEIMRFFQND